MEATTKEIKKTFHLFDKRDGSIKVIFGTISTPEPVSELFGDHFCYVSIDVLLPTKTQLFGIDSFHALIKSVKFIEKFLSGTFA